MSSSVFQKYVKQIDVLEDIVKGANSKIIAEVPDDFVYNNANFFTKSFLVIVCAYIESYIKDILMYVISNINSRLVEAKLPVNLIRWNFNFKEHLEKEKSKYENLKINIKKRDLDKYISANPYLAAKLLQNFGIDLLSDSIFNDQKELINSIVLKRNRVVHHNDDASDLSNGDLISHITIIKTYLANIDQLIIDYLNADS